MASNKFALIKWLDVEDAGHYTVGIPVSWILDFNEEDYLKKEADTAYTVKWQSSNGFKYYNAIVVEITEDVSTLHRHVAAFGGTLSTRILEETEPSEYNENTPLKKFALVKWLDGEDRDHFTVGIPLSWIMDFDENDYLNDAPDQIYLVQWRDSNGLKYYNAIVVEIAEDITTLHRCVKDIEGQLSTRMIINTEQSAGNEKIESGKRAATIPSNTSSIDYSERDKTIHRKKRPKTDASTSPSQQSYESLLKEIMLNKKMILDLRRHVTEIKENINDLLPSKPQSKASKIYSQTSKPDVVEIGNPGSKVFITAQQWAEAQSRETYRSMGLSLLASIFPRQVLIESYLKDERFIYTKTVHKHLDTDKVAAIMEAVRKKFPNEYNVPLLRKAITDKLSHLRQSSIYKMLSKDVTSTQIETDESDTD